MGWTRHASARFIQSPHKIMRVSIEDMQDGFRTRRFRKKMCAIDRDIFQSVEKKIMPRPAAAGWEMKRKKLRKEKKDKKPKQHIPQAQI